MGSCKPGREISAIINQRTSSIYDFPVREMVTENFKLVELKNTRLKCLN